MIIFNHKIYKMKNKNVSRRGVVVYESKYGATRQYAEWLGDKLKLPVIMGAEIKADQLNSCEDRKSVV